MPTINLPIHSLSVLFLFGSIVIFIWFPDKSFSHDLAFALFWWFFALGIVRWIEDGLLYLLPSDMSGDWGNFWKGCRYFVSIVALIAFVVFLILGIQSFLSALIKL
jgi:hypothetical protein